MIGEVIEIFIVMWIVALLAFFPLGYFIYVYLIKSGDPFGDIEPHGDSPSVVADLVDTVIGIVGGGFGIKVGEGRILKK